MAEGGYEFGYDERDLDYKIVHNEQEVDTSRPLKPRRCPVLTTRAKKFKCRQCKDEQSGLPDTSEETPLLHDDDNRPYLKVKKN